jgi:L-amino acid N-acyltransferase YncA
MFQQKSRGGFAVGTCHTDNGKGQGFCMVARLRHLPESGAAIDVSLKITTIATKTAYLVQ